MKAFKHAGLQKKLKETLRNNEKVLWLFEDAHGSALHKLYIIYGLVFTLFWCAAVIVIMRPMVGHPSTLPFLLIFPGVGVFQVIFFGWAFLRRNKFAYAVTDQRVILMNSVGAQFTRSIGPDRILSMSRTGTDQKGTITLSSGHVGWDWSGGLAAIFLPAKIANIPNAKQVEELIYDNLAGPEMRRRETANPNRKPNLFHGY